MSDALGNVRLDLDNFTSRLADLTIAVDNMNDRMKRATWTMKPYVIEEEPGC